MRYPATKPYVKHMVQSMEDFPEHWCSDVVLVWGRPTYQVHMKVWCPDVNPKIHISLCPAYYGFLCWNWDRLSVDYLSYGAKHFELRLREKRALKKQIKKLPTMRDYLWK